MLLAPDLTLGSRYTLRSRIAVGGMGEVWRAEDTVLHREVAVKVLKGDLSGDPSFLDRFRAEARHTAALAHPGIANVFDYGEATAEGSEQTDLAYLVMELIDGEPMSALLGRERRLPADQVLDIVAQTALALGAAHAAGVIHRDVKPGNIMIRPDGTVKITDFGIARAVNAAPVTATGMVMGTSFYLSPEQASGQLVTPASDVYSLGVVGYEAACGRRPFAGDSPLAVAMMHIRDEPPPLPDDVPAPARAVIERAMAKEPTARFETAVDMAAAATAARGGVAPQPSTAFMAGPPAAADPASTQVLPPAAVRAGSPIGPSTAMAAAATTPIPVTPAGPLDPSRPGRVRPSLAVVLAAALLAFLLFAVLAYLVTRQVGGDSGQGASPAASAVSRPPAGKTTAPTVSVNARSYVGKPYDEVKAALGALGLRVRQVPTGEASKDIRPGDVTAVAPTGNVAVGSTITVTVVPAKKGRK